MKRLIIDTETTGLSPRFNKTLTIGLLLINPSKPKLEILDEDHIFVKHKTFNCNREAMRINKIDIEQHKLKAVHPEIACKQINNFIEKNLLHEIPIVGHNINFDKRFLEALFQQGNSNSLIHEESEDTIRIWKDLQREEIIPSNLRANLGTVAEYFDIDYMRAHDALADCHITAKIYHKMLKLQN